MIFEQDLCAYQDELAIPTCLVVHRVYSRHRDGFISPTPPLLYSNQQLILYSVHKNSRKKNFNLDNKYKKNILIIFFFKSDNAESWLMKNMSILNHYAIKKSCRLFNFHIIQHYPFLMYKEAHV